jgi:hypothetical protein
MSSSKIPVDPKLVYQSKTLIGFSIAVTGFVLSSLSQQPWLDQKIADPLGKVGTACGLLLTFVGGIDRPEVFFRKSKMEEAVMQISKKLTVSEANDTAKQALGVLLAPAEQRLEKAVELMVDTQKRLGQVEHSLEGLRPNRLMEPAGGESEGSMQFPAPDLEDFSPDVSSTNDGTFNPMEVI